MHYNSRFVRSVQVVEINHEVLCELPLVFLLFGKDVYNTIGFNHGLPCYVKNMARVTSLHIKMQKMLELECNGQLQTRLLGIMGCGACCYGLVA